MLLLTQRLLFTNNRLDADLCKKEFEKQHKVNYQEQAPTDENSLISNYNLEYKALEEFIRNEEKIFTLELTKIRPLYRSFINSKDKVNNDIYNNPDYKSMHAHLKTYFHTLKEKMNKLIDLGNMIIKKTGKKNFPTVDLTDDITVFTYKVNLANEKLKDLHQSLFKMIYKLQDNETLWLHE